MRGPRPTHGELVEMIVEDLWNGGGPNVPEDLAAAIELVCDFMPTSQDEESFAFLVERIAEGIVERRGR